MVTAHKHIKRGLDQEPRLRSRPCPMDCKWRRSRLVLRQEPWVSS